MKKHLKTIAALIVLIGILTCISYVIVCTPLIGLVILLSLLFVVTYAILYNIIEDSE
jgi:hypothetical protein